LIFDGDCSFCRRWIGRWRELTGDRVDYAPYQEVAEQYPDVAREEFARAAWLVESDGKKHRAARAVFGALAAAPGHSWPLWLYRHLPGARVVSETFYRFVAGHRSLMSMLTTMFWGASVARPTYSLTRWLILRLLGFVYLIAFVSLGVQIRGLVGGDGILPAGDYLAQVHARLGSDAYRQVPTLFWLGSSDVLLQWICWGGAAVAVLAILNIAPAQAFLGLWALYLSFYHVGQTFLSFQWDILLLEIGFLAIFLAPWKLWPRMSSEPAPSRMVRFLVVWLLFRLLFTSGVVKLIDDNPVGREWHELTALNYHYETQCIPTPVAWFAHHLPEWFQSTSVLVMFIIEIGVPFLLFLPRRMRVIACTVQIAFQLLIMLTGNYNFFNLLTIVLCLAVLDDAVLARVLPRRWASRATAVHSRPRMPFVQRMVIPPLAVFVFTVSAIWLRVTFVGHGKLAGTEQRILQAVRPFAVVSTYGLFRHMTTQRPEIIVEGSDDGRTWKSYEFKYKPGDLSRRPPFVAPHQPRLDWQMWFAALGNLKNPRNAWFVRFSIRLLEGSPEVLALLEHNPFAEKPPRFLRAQLYDYRFTTREERKESGNWWKREFIGAYMPPVTLQSFRR
jgi:predicted DCC family thiol-disulfide oxidoreductase YuxK